MLLRSLVLGTNNRSWSSPVSRSHCFNLRNDVIDAKHRCNRLCGLPTVVHIFQYSFWRKERKVLCPASDLQAVGLYFCAWNQVSYLCFTSGEKSRASEPPIYAGGEAKAPCPTLLQHTVPLPPAFSLTYIQTTTASIIGSAMEQSLWEGTEL